jgi:hypothetical protein
MIPKKARDYISIVAEQEGIPEEHLRIMVDEYWKEIKEALVELKHIRVKVHELGYLQTRFSRLSEKAEELSTTYGEGKQYDPKKHDEYRKYTKLMDMWHEEYRYRKEKQEEKKVYKETKQRSKDSSKQVNRFRKKQ